MAKNKPSGNIEKRIKFKNPIEQKLCELLSELPENFTKIDEESFQKFTNIGTKFLEILIEYGKPNLTFIQQIKIYISPKNLKKLNPKLPIFVYDRVSYELESGLIAYLYKKGIPNTYNVNSKLKVIDERINESGLANSFNDIDYNDLINLNNKTLKSLIDNKARDIPDSYIIEIPFLSDTKFWVLYNRKGEITKNNAIKAVKDYFGEDALNYLMEIKDTYVSIFFGDKEPSDLKIKSLDEHRLAINSPIYRDEIGTLTLYGGDYHFESILRLGLENFEKLKALVLLGIAPVILRKEEAEKIYATYGIDITSQKQKENSGDKQEKTKKLENGNLKRNYPYGNSVRLSIENLMEDDDKKEVNSKITHKRLLPIIKRLDGTYLSLKPSLRSNKLATLLGFTLDVGIGFPNNGKCIYPEKIPDLLNILGVENIEAAINLFREDGENVYLRYETIVIPTKKELSEEEVKETIKAKVGCLVS
nr:hypothetical protein [Candidatus Gracilibacteria bacterium]